MLLEDGAWFAGTAPLPFEPSFGEVVFTTNLSGYQEVFTDPSYLGQLVTMTAPMIGNYGINPDDVESDRPRVAGVIVRELSRVPFNWRATGTLLDWLAEERVPIVTGVDTRAVTRHIRSRGAMRGVVALGERPADERVLDDEFEFYTLIVGRGWDILERFLGPVRCPTPVMRCSP